MVEGKLLLSHQLKAKIILNSSNNKIIIES